MTQNSAQAEPGNQAPGQEEAAQKNNEKHSVVVSAVIFALGTLLSRILGLIRDRMTAQYFPNDVRDAFFNAFRLPNFFRRILGEGSLSIAFIPVFVEILSGKKSANQDEAQLRAKRLVGAVFSLLLSITVTLSLLATIYMDEIMRFILSGESYLSVPGKLELTVRLGRIMFWFLALVSLYAFFMAILNSLKKFAMTALAPCFFNLAMITAAWMSPHLAVPEETLAWAVLVGGVLQMLVLVPSVIKAGYFPRPNFAWRSSDVSRIFKIIIPSLFGMSIMQITSVVNMHFTSQLQSGAQSYLYLADRILELPLSLFVVSVGSALLPTLATFWARGERQAMSETMSHYLKLILFIAVPASMGMFMLAQPIVEVLYMGREFRAEDALATAGVIRVYSVTVLIAAGVRLLAQGFYAIQNTWFPTLSAGIALASHLIFAFILTNHFGLTGLAAAGVLSGTVNLVWLAIGYHRWIGGLHIRGFLWSFVQFLFCGIVMAAWLMVHDQLANVLGHRLLIQASVLLFMVFTGAAVYMAMAYWLKIPECRETASIFLHKLQNKMKSKKKARA